MKKNRQILTVPQTLKLEFISRHLLLFKDAWNERNSSKKSGSLYVNLTPMCKVIAGKIRSEFDYSPKTGDYDIAVSWMNTYEKAIEEVPVDAESMTVKKMNESDNRLNKLPNDPSAIKVSTSVIKHIDFTTYDSTGARVHLVLHVNELTGETHIFDAVMDRIIVSGEEQIHTFTEVMVNITDRLNMMNIAKDLDLPF